MSSRAAATKNAKRAEVQDAAEDETADVSPGHRADGLAEEDGIGRDEVGGDVGAYVGCGATRRDLRRMRWRSRPVEIEPETPLFGCT
jgi:hypothetical protein